MPRKYKRTHLHFLDISRSTDHRDGYKKEAFIVYGYFCP